MRPKDGAQRGSVMDMPVYPGDPLTPGVGATPARQRLAVKDAPTLTKIPVLPISYADAQPLLAALKGPVAPDGWRGALPITYRIGPGPARVHLKLAFNWDTKTLYDVIAQMPGRTFPTSGSCAATITTRGSTAPSDPVSGTSVRCSKRRARSASCASRAGSRSGRIVYAAWDGEEPGLLGSTEWVEAHAAELQAHAVVYINTDGNGRGFLGDGGIAHARALHQRRRAGHRRSRDEA